MSSGLKITVDTRSLNDTMARLQAASGRNAAAMVTYWSRKLLRKLAWLTPIAHGPYENRGRARAGWWRAAAGLQVPSVYTPRPDAGEGFFQDGRGDGTRPSVVLGNRVPYIGKLDEQHGIGEAAAAEVEARMGRELEAATRASWDARHVAPA